MSVPAFSAGISDDALVENTQLQVADIEPGEEEAMNGGLPSGECVDPADEDGAAQGEQAGPEDPGGPSDGDEDGEGPALEAEPVESTTKTACLSGYQQEGRSFNAPTQRTKPRLATPSWRRVAESRS